MTATDLKPPEEALAVTEFEPLQPPVSWREFLGIALLIIVCDVTLYRSGAYAAYALCAVIAPWCLMLASPSRAPRPIRWAFLAWLMLYAARLVWCGSLEVVVCAAIVLGAFAMALAERTPYVLELMAYLLQILVAGVQGILFYVQTLTTRRWVGMSRGAWGSGLAIWLPLAAFVVFGSLFILANPDLVSLVSRQWELWITTFREWVLGLDYRSVVFWLMTAWIVIGLLRPSLGLVIPQPPRSVAVAAAADAPLYVPFRNTLVTVIGLFAGYLIFEFQTLWFRVFPKGFHYSGYAHEGAAWLTIALGLATVTLSLIFRGGILNDPRLPRLKRLAWIWSALNLLLAVAVYHRLMIYVEFNGMTRMRVIAFLGITTVVIGFLLAVFKIARQRHFVWLLRADLWALLGMILLHGLLPVDHLVMRYNSRRIMAGDLAPSVQITIHPIDVEGVRQLRPLIESPDEAIREGVKVLFAEWWAKLPKVPEADLDRITSWRDLLSLQLSERELQRELASCRSAWEPYLDDGPRRATAWRRFVDYAYQWY